jgi:hypothetical protein
MNTYIFCASNKDGYEWADDGGDIEHIVASSLEEAVKIWSHFESARNDIYDSLEKNRSAKPKVADILPLNISVSMIPGTATEVKPAVIEAAIQSKIDEVLQEAAAQLDAEAIATIQKQDKIHKLQAEAKKLGISIEDLASSGGW